MVFQFELHKNDGRKGRFIFKMPLNINNYKFNKFRIFLKSIFQIYTKSKPFPYSSGWIVLMWGFHGIFIIGLHYNHK